ncbi:MAG: trypsin-like peptidase domain-containing protein [Gammaproteobacteria bacterium]|nr:trypsin-like peptidase domain-containing protein [Gammaproteobacteria bacterium]
MCKIPCRILLLIVLTVVTAPAPASDVATELFGDNRHLVYQIRVIDQGSGDKSSIGSGFQISSDGYLATNFHVVASYVHKPEKYRLEYVAHDGSTGTLSLAGFDIIHDLAIVMAENAPAGHFTLETEQLDKGDRIYSMGNPQDLGMTIIEGTYNGLIKTSRYQKILFSGSLNPGMSGGPGLNSDGRIIGVNVSKGGEQLSFLVPVAYLKNLLGEISHGRRTGEYQVQIREALLAEQDAFYGPILQREWDQYAMFEVILPGQLDDSLKCWGHTVDIDDILYEGVEQHCKSQDVIYLDQGLKTGAFAYDYEWIETDALNRFQFYDLMESRFVHKPLSNSHSEENSTSYRCQTDFVTLDRQPWRISACTRAYRQYRGLYDALILMASVGKNDHGVIVRIGAAGISKANALGLLSKFTRSIAWNH